MIAFSLMLFSAAIAAWIVSGDPYLRFAAVLYAALAASVQLNLGESVASIVSAVAPAMLALALVRTRFAAPILVLCCIDGLTAAASGVAMLAFAPLLVAALTIAVARRNPQAVASATALVLGAACFVAGSLPALMAFSSAALLGLALQAGVEEQRRRNPRKAGIGAARPAR